MKRFIKQDIKYFEFFSITDFINYIETMPVTYKFKYDQHSQYTNDRFVGFSKTSSFEDAMKLLKYGWNTEVKKIETGMAKFQLNLHKDKRKVINDLVGYQCNVPLFLMGVPQSMVRDTKVKVKNKIITVNKCFSYPSSVSADVILEDSIKALSVINFLESNGFRVNLNIIVGTKSHALNKKPEYIFKVRIKNANERLCIGKVAFPLVHPSMLRRMIFKLMEVIPDMSLDYVDSYGYPVYPDTLRSYSDGEYVFRNYVDDEISLIDDVADFYNVI